MNLDNGSPVSPPGQVGFARRRLRHPLLIAGFFGASLAGLAYLGGGFRGLRGWDLSTAGRPAPSARGTAGTEAADSLSLEINALAVRAGFTPAPRPRAPSLSFRDATGAIGSLERFRGKVVLLAFWGTTCIPCMEELPQIEKLAERFRKTDLVILPLCLDEADLDTARAVAARVAPGLSIAVDADGSARRCYEVRALPQAVLIDRAGRVVARSLGAKKWDRKEMDELFCAALGIPYPPGVADKPM